MFILDTLYGDYEISYQTQTNEYLLPLLVILGIFLALVVLYFISLMKIFKKANRSGVSALIPIYNFLVLLEVVNQPKWKFIYFLIPILNIIYFCQVMYQLARYFRKTKNFSLMTAIFPLILVPVIGFGGSEYIGINEEAMSGVSKAKDLPVEGEKRDPTRPDQPIKERTKVNMSIGGGVYQKEYQDSLLKAKNVKEVKSPEMADFRVDPTEFAQPQNQQPEDFFQGINYIETPSTSGMPEPSAPIMPEQNASIMPEQNAPVMPEPSAPVMPEQNAPIGEPVLSAVNSPQNEIPAVQSTPIPTVSASGNAGINLLANSNNVEVSVVPSIEKQETNDFINNTPSIEQKPLNNNIDSHDLSFVAPTNAQDAQVSDLPNIFAPRQEEQKPEEMASSNLSFEIDPKIQGLNDEKLKEQAEFIACPYCGSKVKNGSARCFMCGKPL